MPGATIRWLDLARCRAAPRRLAGARGYASWVLAPLLVLVLVLGPMGCATYEAPAHARSQVWDDAAYGPTVPVPTAQDIFALTPAMKAFLEGPAQQHLRVRGPQRGLVEALFEKGRLRIEYDATRTRTAAETFDERAGNCLSLVVMTAALAHELGLAVRYQDMDTHLWEHQSVATLDLRIGHVNVLIGREALSPSARVAVGSWLMVDFLSQPGAVPDTGRPIDEARIVAMLLNNRAGEALVQGDLRSAYWHAKAAVAADDGFAHAWNTLGIVHSRHGDQARAELALRLALQRNSAHDAAMGNLAGVLRQQGRIDEAELWARREQQFLPDHPMALLAAGLKLLDAGDAHRARRMLERALSVSGGSHEIHFALARAFAALGDAPAAARQLELAREAGQTPQMRSRYAAKLDRLRDQMNLH